MSVGQLSLFDALKQKMHWHQARQSLLAENVANAETPGYRGQDLKPFEFEGHMRENSTASVHIATTRPNHIGVSSRASGGYEPHEMNSFQITPEGNGVVLEDEMMKVSTNQMDYQAATTLYTRSMRLLRTALGRSG